MDEKIILGLGNNVDYEIVWDSKIFENLIIKFDIKNAEITQNIEINSQRNLVISILSFLKCENGGECFVSSSDIIEEFSKNFENRVTLGGTSIRAAIAMNKIGYTSALHMVTINDYVRRLIPNTCQYVCSAKKDASYPHLIIQFCKGTVIKVSDIYIETSRSNRIIYDNDYDNIMMELDDKLLDISKNAKVFLISGFNTMHDENLLKNRLFKLSEILNNLPKDTCIFYENACFFNKSFPAIVNASLCKKIDIFSLNEDELQEYLNKKIDLLNPIEIKKALVQIKKIIPVPIIVVHTRFWALAYGKNAVNLKAALKGGITMAGTRFMFGDNFTLKNYNDTQSYDLQIDGVKFSENINALMGDEVCSLPCIQADETNAVTIGLGDAFVGGFLPKLVAYY